MLDSLTAEAGTAEREPLLLKVLETHEAAVLKSAGRGDRAQVERAEAAVRADPTRAFEYDASGGATLTATGRAYGAGHFEVVSIGELRRRAVAGAARGRLRLWVMDGAAAATDIGSLQAHASADTLFQIASQFNCLEAPGPWIRPVHAYFSDPTQGPRASISAFAGTLLRHYAAPGGSAKAGARFVQTEDGPQVELLAEVCRAGTATVRNGYLLSENIPQAKAFGAALRTGFEAIRLGVHAELEVALGYDWDGAVQAPPPRIAQVFTSTLAAGPSDRGQADLLEVCRQLLRAAYLGTLLAAVSLGQRRVVLTLIGGGAFGNPLPLIWEAITWALDEVEPVLGGDLAVIVNGRTVGVGIDAATLLAAVRRRGGAVLTWGRGGAPPRIHR
jgi:hypothetical protein